ncbi:MAG: (d)CMP kinase [Planctomycetota bacterium]
MIVTIDGPAGSGKSSVSREVARRLGFDFLDTGAMYRAVTWAALDGGIDLFRSDSIAKLAKSITLRFDQDRVYVNNVDVTHQIRTPEVTSAIHHVADCVAARAYLSEMQRSLTSDADFVTDGRDQGTEVFPQAQCKIYLTASPEERARRRQKQLEEKGVSETLESILKGQEKRDREDRQRPVGSLRPAEDAFILYSDSMTPEEVVDRIVEVAAEVIGKVSTKESGTS